MHFWKILLTMRNYKSNLEVADQGATTSPALVEGVTLDGILFLSGGNQS